MRAPAPDKRFRLLSVLMAAALSGTLLILLYDTERTSLQVFSLFGMAFSCYIFLLLHRKKFNSALLFAGVAIGLRLALLFATPALSDDYYRFAWDGRLVAAGINPYGHLPAEVRDSPEMQHIDPTGQVFEGLNSKPYYSVYPPLNQLMFGAAAWLSRGDLQANVIWLRILIWLGEAFTVFFLIKLLVMRGRDPGLWVVYALNPLVIVELTGNLHFEGWLVAFVLGAVYFFERKKSTASGLMLAGGALVKLLPLIFIPMLWARQTWKQRLWFSAALAAAGLVFCTPFFSFNLAKKFSSSVDLYFRTFEFNASVYYLFRTVGIWLKGYNPIAVIGPLLGLLSLSAVLFLSFSRRFAQRPLEQVALLILGCYFLLTTTVHPWYIVTLVALAALHEVRWPLVWSCVVILSYSHYFGGRFEENYWMIGLEYAILAGVMVAEKKINWLQKFS